MSYYCRWLEGTDQKYLTCWCSYHVAVIKKGKRWRNSALKFKSKRRMYYSMSTRCSRHSSAQEPEVRLCWPFVRIIRSWSLPQLCTDLWIRSHCFHRKEDIALLPKRQNYQKSRLSLRILDAYRLYLPQSQYAWRQTLDGCHSKRVSWITTRVSKISQSQWVEKWARLTHIICVVIWLLRAKDESFNQQTIGRSLRWRHWTSSTILWR